MQAVQRQPRCAQRCRAGPHPEPEPAVVIVQLDVVITLDSGGGTVELHGRDLTPLALAEVLRLLATVGDGVASSTVPEPALYRPAST